MLKPSTPIRSGLPPGPKGSAVRGSIREFGTTLLDFLRDTAREYGPLASCRVGPKRIFLASDPDLIEQVLVRDAKHYVKHFGARAFKPVLGNGLVTSEGAYWQRQRKLVQPAFMKARVRSYAPVMASLTDKMLEAWSPGDQIDVNFAFGDLTSRIALKTLFDLDDAGDRERFTETLKFTFDIMTARLSRLIKISAVGADAGECALQPRARRARPDHSRFHRSGPRKGQERRRSSVAPGLRQARGRL